MKLTVLFFTFILSLAYAEINPKTVTSDTNQNLKKPMKALKTTSAAGIDNRRAETSRPDIHRADNLYYQTTKNEPPMTRVEPESPIVLDQQMRMTAQRVLSQKGYYSGKIDGEPSVEMSRALKDFQKNNDLVVNGVLNQRTFDYLTVEDENDLTPQQKRDRSEAYSE